jgi:hypothetical protein
MHLRLTSAGCWRQVLAKSCKMIPVMGMGLVLGKKYPQSKYVCVGVITTGVALFMMKPQKAVEDQRDHDTFMGIVLLLFSLMCDGRVAHRRATVLADHQTELALSPQHDLTVSEPQRVVVSEPHQLTERIAVPESQQLTERTAVSQPQRVLQT